MRTPIRPLYWLPVSHFYVYEQKLCFHPFFPIALTFSFILFTEFLKKYGWMLIDQKIHVGYIVAHKLLIDTAPFIALCDFMFFFSFLTYFLRVDRLAHCCTHFLLIIAPQWPVRKERPTAVRIILLKKHWIHLRFPIYNVYNLYTMLFKVQLTGKLDRIFSNLMT